MLYWSWPFAASLRWAHTWVATRKIKEMAVRKETTRKSCKRPEEKEALAAHMWKFNEAKRTFAWWGYCVKRL